MDDGTVIILRRHGNPSGPRLVLSHGCGLSADLIDHRCSGARAAGSVLRWTGPVRSSFLPGIDLSTLTALDYDFVPEMTHFLQLEAPETCASMTVEFLEAQSLA